MPYLVVVYEDGKEKQCNFKYEDQVDAFVASVKERFPQIKTVSEAAEKRLAEAEKKQAEKCLIPLSEQAKETVNVLEQAKAASRSVCPCSQSSPMRQRKRERMRRQSRFTNGSLYSW